MTAPSTSQTQLTNGLPVLFSLPPASVPETPAQRAARTLPSSWLQGLVAPTQTVPQSIQISNAIIDGPLNFGYVTFDCPVEFSSCEFINGDIDFSFATFCRSANFTNCLFSYQGNPGADPVTFRASHAKADLGIALTHFSFGSDFSDIHVDENLSASGAYFEKVTFRRMEVAKNAQFAVDKGGNRTIFHGKTFFVGVHISSDAEFAGALFSDLFVFDNARVEGNAFFCTEEPDPGDPPLTGRTPFRARFEGETRFLGAHFYGDAVFLGAEFTGPASFDRVQVDANAFFRKDEYGNGVIFEKPVRFPLAVFSSGVQFKDAHFKGGADFRYARFSRAAEFNGVNFDGDVDFTSAHSESDIRFECATFSKASSFREASFRVVFFGQSPVVATKNIGKNLLKDAKFGGGIDLRGLTYERIYVDLDALLDKCTPFDRQPYAQLESALRKTGADSKANAVYLKRRQAERRRKFERGFYLLWLMDWAYKIFADYGVRPWLTLLWATGTLLLGAWLFMQPGALDTKDPRRNAPPAPSADFLPALGVSFHQFLPIDVPVGDYWVPASHPVKMKITPSGQSVWMMPSVYATVALRLFGTLLQGLLIGQLTGFLRRTAP